MKGKGNVGNLIWQIIIHPLKVPIKDTIAKGGLQIMDQNKYLSKKSFQSIVI